MFHRDNGNKINCKITRVCSFLLATCASKVKVKVMKSSLIQNRKFNPNPFPPWDGGLFDCFPFLIFIAPHRIVDVYGYGIIFDCWCKWHHIFHICGNFLICEERRWMNWLYVRNALHKRESNLLFSLSEGDLERKSNPLFSPLSAPAPTHFLSLLPLNRACHTILQATWPKIKEKGFCFQK